MEICRKIERLFDANNSTLVAIAKTFKTVPTPDLLFEVIRQMEAEIPLLPYKTDGYIFMPETMPYDSGNDELSFNKRVLTKYADIVKWKSAYNMTIDFAIIWTSNFIQLYVGDKNSNDSLPSKPYIKISLFVGTPKFPFNPNDIDLTGLIDRKEQIPSGSIVEFRWDITINKFVMTRIREDKDSPNLSTTASNNWEMIHLPIDIEVLKGRSDALIRKYHNRVKRNLFTESSDRIGNRGKSLLDIGIGRGGDLSKMLMFNKIIGLL